MSFDGCMGTRMNAQYGAKMRSVVLKDVLSHTLDFPINRGYSWFNG